MSPDAGFDLCLIVDGSPAQTRAAERVLRGSAGRIALQLRMKQAALPTVRETARDLQRITRDTSTPLYLNTHTGLAAELGCAGVQLPAAQVRAGLRPDERPAGLRLGASCHDAGEIACATRIGASFVILSPFAPVPGKGPALGAEAFARLARPCSIPVVALGGLHASNVAAAVGAGAAAIACIRGVLDAADPALAAERLLDAVRAAR